MNDFFEGSRKDRTAISFRLCHALDLAHSESGVMGRDFAYLGTRLVCPQNGIEEDCGSCQLDIGQLALLRHHRWLHGLPKSAVEITVR